MQIDFYLERKVENMLSERKRRLYLMVENEIMTGIWKKEGLLNSSQKIEKETEALYYSNARKNLCSDIVYEIMHGQQQLDDLYVMRECKYE